MRRRAESYVDMHGRNFSKSTHFLWDEELKFMLTCMAEIFQKVRTSYETKNRKLCWHAWQKFLKNYALLMRRRTASYVDMHGKHIERLL